MECRGLKPDWESEYVVLCQITVQLVKNNPFYQFGDSCQYRNRSVVIRNAFLAIFVHRCYFSYFPFSLLIERLNKLARDGAIMESASFNSLVEIPFRPEALFVGRALIKLRNLEKDYF